jgi:hypothetical protein
MMILMSGQSQLNDTTWSLVPIVGKFLHVGYLADVACIIPDVPKRRNLGSGNIKKHHIIRVGKGTLGYHSC